ncbi:hypothetical protein [Arenimonas sp. MALMAid1274]|uniref:extracellular catalytic domain type 2 short-chain-length polyhydroxyalkanoate depolymerase n=1 Tax=Arenimonas sp. MALMAid1274 TaxID=3411630 RepID=UPI003B9F0284
MLLAAGCSEPRPAPLPRLVIDPDRVAVAGLSSGAYMATQTHFAWSDHLRGAGLVAGGPYGCADGKMETALGPCMIADPGAPDVDALAASLVRRAEQGDIAPLAGLARDRVHVSHGTGDRIVNPVVSRASAMLYEKLGGADQAPAVHWDGERAFGHLMPTVDAGVDCVAGGSPYLGACGWDAAGEQLAWIFGDAPVPAAAATGELRRFDQDVLLADGQDAQLAADGFLYVPAACAAGETCGALVVFHGCEQNEEKVGEAFVRDAGYNRWADVHRLVVLYPQVRSSYLPLNPKACWDWWGYTGPDYDTRRGAQQRWLAAAMAALGAPLDAGAPPAP